MVRLNQILYKINADSTDVIDDKGFGLHIYMYRLAKKIPGLAGDSTIICEIIYLRNKISLYFGKYHSRSSTKQLKLINMIADVIKESILYLALISNSFCSCSFNIVTDLSCFDHFFNQVTGFINVF